MASNGGEGRRLMIYAVLLLLVFHVTGSQSTFFPENRGHDFRVQQESEPQETEVHCSRPRSRIARAIIDEYLVPFLEQEQYNLSTNCRLHSVNDMFQEQEQQKDTLRPTQWQCGYCKKIFRSEEYLDKHFDSRHYDKLDLNPSRCVAGMCGALHCDYVNSQGSIGKKKSCNRAAVTKNKHLCESLANSCFPPQESAKAMRLHEAKEQGTILSFSLFTIILLLIFYVAIYLYRRELGMNSANLKRLAQHGVLKAQSAKKQ